MKTIDALSKADFEPLVGQSLMVGGVELHIDSVRDGKGDGGFERKPFSVILTAAEAQGAPVFHGPVKVVHEALGEHDLTVARIMGRHDEAVYQIVFN